MAQAKAFLNQHSTDVILTAASTTPGSGVSFGFQATSLELRNDAGVPVRFSLNSTGVASTSDAELKSGEIMPLVVPPVSGLGITTTSTDAGGGIVRVRAWG